MSNLQLHSTTPTLSCKSLSNLIKQIFCPAQIFKDMQIIKPDCVNDPDRSEQIRPVPKKFIKYLYPLLIRPYLP